MPTKANLLSTLQATQAEILRLAGSLTEDERNISGPADNWGPRDILVHLGENNRTFAGDLATARRGETPPQGDRPERSNAAIYEIYRTRPWADIASLLEESHQEMIDQIQAFSEAELNDPDHFAWMSGTPVWRRAAGSSFVHATVHLFQAHMARGDQESARRLKQLEKERGLTLDSSESWQGMVHYNQGCYHALFGEKDQALRELEQGLRLSAQFIGFSLEDSDLASLHHDPDFLAMLERVKQHA